MISLWKTFRPDSRVVRTADLRFAWSTLVGQISDPIGFIVNHPAPDSSTRVHVSIREAPSTSKAGVRQRILVSNKARGGLPRADYLGEFQARLLRGRRGLNPRCGERLPPAGRSTPSATEHDRYDANHDHRRDYPTEKCISFGPRKTQEFRLRCRCERDRALGRCPV